MSGLIKSLKNKLLVSFLLLASLPAIAISLYYYTTEKTALENSAMDASRRDLVYILDNVDRQLNQAGQLSDWTFINRTLERLFLLQGERLANINADETRSFQDVLSDHIINASVRSYVTTLILHGDNGLVLKAGDDANLVDDDALAAQPWFRERLSESAQLDFSRMIRNPAPIHDEAWLIPVIRPIMASRDNKILGWSFIGFRLGLVTDAFTAYASQTSDPLVLINSRGQYLYNSSHPELVGTIIDSTINDQLRERSHSGSIRPDAKSPAWMYLRSDKTGWVMMKAIPDGLIQTQKNTLLQMSLLIFGLSLLVTLALSFFLSYSLTGPLRRLLRRMKAISGGDFSPDPGLEGPDEIGQLGHGINAMSSSIRDLLTRLIDEEKQKQRLELNVLQSQINPHFLYNTLNSIRWIAMIQKADTVTQAITSLGRLLRSTLGETAQTVPLSEELSLLDDYMLIQKLRYKGKVEMHLEPVPHAAENCQIPRLTLQPLVENAIFHGIEPKNGSGCITVSVSLEAQWLCICIADDGVGMSEDQVARILEHKAQAQRGLSGIGVVNVHDRLRLIYGHPAGLTVTSEPGSGTVVSVRFPAIPLKPEGEPV